MKVLQLHTRYLHAGGEDKVVAEEHQLLTEAGHTVEQLVFDNADAGALATAKGLFHNPTVTGRIVERLQTFGPDVVHVHNLWYQAGPTVFETLHQAGVATVATLHNYRLLCLNGLQMREGKSCTLCQQQLVPWSGIRHACNRGSLAGSLVVGSALGWHKRRGTFALPHRIICLTEYQRQVHLNSLLGFKPEQVVVKPNFTQDPGFHAEPRQQASAPFFLFAGRLSEEKGAQFLPMVASAGYTVMVAGDGPLMPQLQQAAATLPTLKLLGWQTEGQVMALMQQATALLILSTCNEGLPMVLPKAMAVGLPIITNDMPNLALLIRQGEHGWVVQVQQPGQLASACAAAVQQQATGETGGHAMRQALRNHYLQHYTPVRNLSMLETIYEAAMQEAGKGRG